MSEESNKKGANGSPSMTMRIRIVFAKTETMRFTSHLDLYRAWERLLRRADVSLVFSQGYNPRPRLQLAAPLPLGITSRAEIIDFWIANGPEDINSIRSKLVYAQPPGIEILQVNFVNPKSPPLQKKVSASEYRVSLLDEVPGLEIKIASVLNANTLMRQRREKEYDLRPLILDLTYNKSESDPSWHLFMRLTSHGGGTGRPEEVLLALEIQPENTLIERTRLVF
jgi:radical SAM-linked protein